MQLYRFASVDIGSNAVRLFFALVIANRARLVKIKKLSLLRVPIRLGEDTFLRKRISNKKANALVKAMRAFKDLCPEYGVQAYEACATSAIRDAINGHDIVKRVKKEAGININIIDGQLEAKMIFNSSKNQKLGRHHTCLFIDVGGGSSELTLLAGSRIIASRSFNIGTIRLLQDKVLVSEWIELKKWHMI
jgi:exopolyphosphatase/guanosine-5'-triphosphate,3'-diphosphate pyrophosphatase